MKLETLFAGVEYTGHTAAGDVTPVTQDSRRPGRGCALCVQGHLLMGMATASLKALEAGADVPL